MTVGPRWSSDSLAPEERGQYPLAVENAIAFHARNLVPFTTTVTAHPRYYALHARAAAVMSDDETAAKELLRRLEVLLGVASLLHAQNAPEAHDPAGTLSAPHGFRAIGAALNQGPTLDLAGLAGTYGGNSFGYSGAYRGVEQTYGMSGRQCDARMPLGADAMSALNPLVALASQGSVSISELQDGDLCVCALRGSADGRALRTAFFFDTDRGAPEDVRAARRAGRLTTQLCLKALDGEPVTAPVTDALADLCCYGDVDGRLAGDGEGISASAARWRGALLRNQSVTAWRWLWWWLTAELDRLPSSSDVLTRAFADELIAGGSDQLLSEAVWDQLPALQDADGLLPAERVLREPSTVYGTSPLLWLRMLAVGVRRLEELDEAALGHFSIGRDDWGPTETRQYLADLEGKRLSQVAEDLVPKLLRRAQSVARRRQQWTRHGLRMPTRLRPVGDILYVTGPEGTGEAALRQFRLVQMLNSLGVFGVEDGRWAPGPHAGAVAA